MPMEKISVIIPIYNVSEVIERCILSIVNQTYTEWELILVDDGSSDDSLAICLNYKKKDSRIKVFSQKNSGPAIARNKGLKNITGEWVLFVDSDDYVEANYFENMISGSKGADIVISGHLIENGNRVIKKILPTRGYVNGDNGADILGECKSKGCTHDYIWDKMYRSKIILENNIEFRTVRIGEDTIFNFEYFYYVRRAQILPNAYYHYQLGGNSLSKGYKSDFLISYEMQMDALDKLISSSSNPQFSILKFCEILQVRRGIFGFIHNYFYCNSYLTQKQRFILIKKHIFENTRLLSSIKNCNPSILTINQMVIRFLICMNMPTLLTIYLQTIKIFK